MSLTGHSGLFSIRNSSNIPGSNSDAKIEIEISHKSNQKIFSTVLCCDNEQKKNIINNRFNIIRQNSQDFMNIIILI